MLRAVVRRFCNPSRSHSVLEAKWQRTWGVARQQTGDPAVPWFEPSVHQRAAHPGGPAAIVASLGGDSGGGGGGATTTPTNETLAVPKLFVLSQFPYPSGELHMGHVRVYTIGDLVARAGRMAGARVLHPIGWDSFGLPAENAARDRGRNPRDWTRENILAMRASLLQLGVAFGNAPFPAATVGAAAAAAEAAAAAAGETTESAVGADNQQAACGSGGVGPASAPQQPAELSTCEPQYYRWTQWLFTRMLRRGVAYRAEAPVYWDPVDQTVLANEQVDAAGRSWRSGALAERRTLSQWFLRITDFADNLTDGLDALEQGWPRDVRRMQEEWIGRSPGAVVAFALLQDPLSGDVKPRASANECNSTDDDAADDVGAGVTPPPSSSPSPSSSRSPSSPPPPSLAAIEVFTTRPDTVLAATFVAVAPDHPVAQACAARDASLAARLADVERGAAVSEAAAAEKTRRGHVPTGCDLGVRVAHPVTGAELPVFAADYVLASYGTAAVMGVPSGDDRDAAFAAAHGLAVAPPDVVVDVEESHVPSPSVNSGAAQAPESPHRESPGTLAFDAAMDLLGDSARRETRFRLRDWLVSRQRRWGTPIPVVRCADCGDVPVPDAELPVRLPQGIESMLTSSPEADAALAAWRATTCPTCKGPAERETDTMDTFVDSSWYYARFPDEANANEIVAQDRARDWLPVNVYIGGREHAILHLLYARFIARFLVDGT
jgi:leucyl-tRNA synthetase